MSPPAVKLTVRRAWLWWEQRPRRSVEGRGLRLPNVVLQITLAILMRCYYE
jgi:hypothetical protein